MKPKGNILITGGSGFLGRAILRKAEREGWPAHFTVYSRDETKQWELKRRYPHVRCVLGDVRGDLARLIAVMHGHDLVIHAAAVKYIPEAEFNVFEAVEVNIDGSRNVAMAAIAAQVATVVGVSTDKACAPLNLYGMTKAVMERLFGEANRMSQTRFVTVRYGNVIGSTGSVIPAFKGQIERDGGVKVTDKRMTRFWLSHDAAVEQVLWAAESATKYPGSTFINPCSAMAIVDLAQAVWQSVGRDGVVPITYTGIRPGEKLHEALFNEQEGPRAFVDDSGFFVLKPATDPAPLGEGLHSYASDMPSRWVGVDEMAGLITEAEGV